ncbi:uncharacterized protein LOC110251673 [Exaiptasia diaphana]|uniref:Uncharacterized protein n=1 Tax=Exaiptasia diaphana TaxID=2652724 RepID=A0A913Y2G5_EXADI|nr:uncharacterized protein LOC110251673 [Exaiptasia diaphana]KXJ22856.1 hypothetical protein AC249_AIPGENE26181 [Exaiptasia diaphana]
MKIVFAIFMVTTVQMTLCDEFSCRDEHSLRRWRDLKHVLKHLYAKYTAFFVDMGNDTVVKQQPPRRVNSRTRRDTAAVRPCPFEWVENVQISRYPSTIVQAECSKCSTLCTPVYYSQMVFDRRCDKKTGHVVWLRRWYRTPISFELPGDSY